MFDVAKKKPASGPKSKPGRARDRGKVRVITIELDPVLDDALERCLQDERRTKRATVSLAIEAYLKARNFWPPPADDASSD
jgi:hypothetical protein